MADHRVNTFVGTSTVDVSIASSHRSRFLTQIRTQDIEQRLTEGEPSSLVSYQRSKNVAGSQHGGNRHAYCLLTCAQVAASGNFSGVPKGSNFIFDSSC